METCPVSFEQGRFTNHKRPLGWERNFSLAGHMASAPALSELPSQETLDADRDFPTVTLDPISFGADVASVIALRLMRIAAGGSVKPQAAVFVPLISSGFRAVDAAAQNGTPKPLTRKLQPLRTKVNSLERWA